MTEIKSKDPEEMKRFLFHELSEKEREKVEERFFTDQDFFYDLTELENTLVDAYIRKELKSEDLKRFEASLEKSPERREKINDAIALKTLIERENQTNRYAFTEPQLSFWKKLSSFFSLQISATQYVTAVLLILLLSGTAFLIYDRVLLNQELANYRENQKNIEELRKHEQNLQVQLDQVKEREQNLQNQISEKEGEREILSQELEREKAGRKQIEQELNRLKNLPKNLPTTVQPQQSTIATIIISPFLGSRGEERNNIKSIKISPNIKSIHLTLQVPKESTAELFIVRFKEQTISSKQEPQTTKSGVKFIKITIPVNQFSKTDENTITLLGNNGVRYDYLLKIKP